MSRAGTGADPARHAAVAVPVPLRRLFTYSVDADRFPDLEPGTRVRVPFGPRTVEATVVEYPVQAPDAGVKVRALLSPVLLAPRLSASLLDLTRFVADYYLCSWGEAIEAALPGAARRPPREVVVRRTPRAATAELSARATARRALLDRLPASGAWVAASSLDAAARRVLPALERQGWIERSERSPRAPAPGGGKPRAPAPEPTREQASALERVVPAIRARRFAAQLLFGVTGSGKTEVYLRAARETLDLGRSVLYLVPEIGLTPLLRSRIADRFPGEFVVLHSALPARERAQAWARVREGDVRFVIGTRSAVFAPLEDIGLIVVDEEQDSSYKQGERPRYNGRDLAVYRGRAEGAVVLLGSATPSMESFQHARSGRYALLKLERRIEHRHLPTVGLVDMRLEYGVRGEVSPVSAKLIGALRECLERGEQALVLRNRRGWAPALLCPRCGNRVQCDRCSITMTWHRTDRRLRCHYCELEHPYPSACPTCLAPELKPLGEGTERVEEILIRKLRGARIERMDRDTLRRRGAQEALLRRFDRGEIDVLVGTQMIAKGHDFPRVTLVGVLSADQSLGLPDFRAGERTFQLLTQVAGRAGRGARPGRVLVQAFDPAHPILGLAAAQDYEAFFEREIAYRRALKYPPVTGLVQLLISDADPFQAREWAERLAQALGEAGGGRLILGGPGPAPVERIKGQYRQQILARTAGRRRLVEAVGRALEVVEGSVPRRAIVVDVDPYSLL